MRQIHLTVEQRAELEKRVFEIASGKWNAVPVADIDALLFILEHSTVEMPSGFDLPKILKFIDRLHQIATRGSMPGAIACEIEKSGLLRKEQGK